MSSLVVDTNLSAISAYNNLNQTDNQMTQAIEELSSGRSRGAGIRVVVGETTGFAHTADLSEAGLLAAALAVPLLLLAGFLLLAALILLTRLVPTRGLVAVLLRVFRLLGVLHLVSSGC